MVDEEEFTIWVDFVLAHTHVTRAVDSALRRECGLSFSHYDALYNIAAAGPDGLSASRIGEALLYSTGSVTNLLNRMTALDLVHRERSTTDRRVSTTTMTAHGRSVFERATEVLLAAVQESFSGQLRRTERAPVGAFLARLHAQDRTLREPPYEVLPHPPTAPLDAAPLPAAPLDAAPPSGEPDVRET